MSSAWSALQGPRRPPTQAPARLLVLLSVSVSVCVCVFVFFFFCFFRFAGCVCHDSFYAEANSQRMKHSSKCFAVATCCFTQARDGTIFVGHVARDT